MFAACTCARPGPMMSWCLRELVAVFQQPDHNPAQSSGGEDTYLGGLGGMR